MSAPVEFGAMPVRSPLRRQRTWVSDGVWIAHETMPMFDRLAALMPSDGVWALGQGGASKVGTSPGNLVGLVARLAATARPCYEEHRLYEAHATMDEAMMSVSTRRVCIEVVDGADGAVWYYDMAILAVARRRSGLEWRLAGDLAEPPTLLAVDRKGRPRFALAPMLGEPVDEVAP